MKISEFSVKHSLIINLISLFILIAGFFTLFVFKIRREAFPEVSYDMDTVDPWDIFLLVIENKPIDIDITRHILKDSPSLRIFQKLSN